MKYLKYILIGLIQGLTEPLPISSSAHMIFINYYFKGEPLSLSSEVFINFASTLAIFIFFFSDILTLIKNTFSKKTNHYLNRRYTINLIVASIPAVLIGLLFSNYIDTYFMNFFTSSVCIIITSVILIIACILLKKKCCCNEEISTSSAITIGIFQASALLPGLSRSGLTLTAGLSRGITIKHTLQFSFFLYLIASIGALVLTFIKTDYSNLNYLEIIISSVTAFISTSFSIRWFYHKLNLSKLKFFSIYTMLLGIINLIIYFH